MMVMVFQIGVDKSAGSCRPLLSTAMFSAVGVG